ncbi:MAG: DUF4355 domain-containing protein [bacterium]|nr:DUF4355 domain-containing protein [bacterium]
MDIETLKKLLENGTITQAQFDEFVKAMNGDNGGGDNSGDDNSADDNKDDNKGFSADDIEKMIQSRVDKMVAKFGKEKADMKKELDELRKKNLSDEERRQLESQEREKELAEKERMLADRENRFYAMKAIKNVGLDDGSEEALNIIDFVLGDTEEVINEKVKNFKALVDKMVLNATDKKFKDNGRTLSSSNNKKTADNPYSKDTFNFTKQMELEKNNPELAVTLKREAGLC